MRASREREFLPAQAFSREGEPGDEVFILLSGEVTVFRRDAAGERIAVTEKAGGFIGKMAVLDATPRAATVRAGAEGARVLCLEGEGFRKILGANPSVARGVISLLASRLRAALPWRRKESFRGRELHAPGKQSSRPLNISTRHLRERAGHPGSSSTLVQFFSCYQLARKALTARRAMTTGNNYGGRPMRRTRSWKAGSECRATNRGSSLRCR